MSKKKDDSVTHYEAYSAIRDIIGNIPLSQIFTKDKIKACQKIIDTEKDNFFNNAEKELELVDKIFKKAKGKAHEYLQEIIPHISSIKSHSEALGFSLITEICSYIIENYDSKKIDPEKRVKILSTLFEGLKIAFHKKIKDDGGKTGKELLLSLQSIVS